MSLKMYKNYEEKQYSRSENIIVKSICIIVPNKLYVGVFKRLKFSFE